MGDAILQVDINACGVSSADVAVEIEDFRAVSIGIRPNTSSTSRTRSLVKPVQSIPAFHGAMMTAVVSP